MKDRDTPSEKSVEIRYDLIGQRDLRDQDDSLPAGCHSAPDHLDIDLCLAAACHTVQKDRPPVILSRMSVKCIQRRLLLRRILVDLLIAFEAVSMNGVAILCIFIQFGNTHFLECPDDRPADMYFFNQQFIIDHRRLHQRRQHTRPCALTFLQHNQKLFLRFLFSDRQTQHAQSGTFAFIFHREHSLQRLVECPAVSMLHPDRQRDQGLIDRSFI